MARPVRPHGASQTTTSSPEVTKRCSPMAETASNVPGVSISVASRSARPVVHNSGSTTRSLPRRAPSPTARAAVSTLRCGSLAATAIWAIDTTSSSAILHLPITPPAPITAHHVEGQAVHTADRIAACTRASYTKVYPVLPNIYRRAYVSRGNRRRTKLGHRVQPHLAAVSHSTAAQDPRSIGRTSALSCGCDQALPSHAANATD